MTVRLIRMSVQDWIAVPDNPVQRDTVRGAASAKRRHLASHVVAHDEVHAAVYKGAILCKVDGHKRALLWESGELKMPLDKCVNIYPYVCCAKTRKDALEEAVVMYDWKDSKGPLKDTSDTLYGSLRSLNIFLQSPLLKASRFSVGLQIAEGHKWNTSKDSRIFVQRWANELVTLDSWGLTPRRISAPIVALALMTICRYGAKRTKDFFVGVNGDIGNKSSLGRDGIDALVHHLDVRSKESRMTGWTNLLDICSRSLSAYMAWRTGRMLGNNSGLRLTSTDELVEFCKRKHDAKE